MHFTQKWKECCYARVGRRAGYYLFMARTAKNGNQWTSFANPCSPSTCELYAANMHAVGSSALSVPKGDLTICRLAHLTGGHAFDDGSLDGRVCEISGYRESVELVAGFNPAHPADTAKFHWTGHKIKSWQGKLNNYLHSRRRALRRQDEHSALPYVSAMANVVMFHAVGPAEQHG